MDEIITDEIFKEACAKYSKLNDYKSKVAKAIEEKRAIIEKYLVANPNITTEGNVKFSWGKRVDETKLRATFNKLGIDIPMKQIVDKTVITALAKSRELDVFTKYLIVKTG